MKSFFALVLATLGTSLANAWSCNDPGATTKMTFSSLATVSPEAVCNDRSAAAYYYAAGAPAPSPTFLIYLGGGGQCYDRQSCEDRWTGKAYPHHNCDKSSTTEPCFMSSKDFPRNACLKTGIFSADTSKNSAALAAANKVYVPYCSSDAHMGDGEMAVLLSGRATKFYFKGLKIVEAVITDLVKRRGLNSKSRIIFGGGSAGGRGAMALLDHVASFVPRGALVLGFLDSAYYVDVKPYSASPFIGFDKVMQLATENFVSDKLTNCAKNVPKWKCTFGQYRAPQVKTPFFLVASQYDSWQLSHLLHNYDGLEKQPTYTAAETSYAESFAKTTRDGLINLVAPDTIFGPTTSRTVFSPACYSHHESEKPLFWERKDSNGNSMAQAFSTFLRDHEKQYIDQCDTLNCQCSPASSIDLTTVPVAITTVPISCNNANKTVCESSLCGGDYTWTRSKCYKIKVHHHSASGVGVLVALLVILLLVGGGAAAFIIITKLRRKSQYGGGGGDNFLVIGEPV